ncbi:hypothetical protein GMMP15_2020007 [Candidatus Magnetomoraceae bacterium gMMP-15]
MLEKYKIYLLSILAALLFMAGCAQMVPINIKKPGELKLQGISKIAIIDFNTIKSDPNLGKYAAKSDTLELAKKNVLDIFYKLPFYTLTDLSLEKKLENDMESYARKTSHRFDAVLYGKLWWQLSEEYDNVRPKTYNLEKWKNMKYVCGKDKKGRPIYCTKHITLSTEDKFVKEHYRAVNSSLMLSLSIYKMDGGIIKKLTQVFEIAKLDAKIINGCFTLNKPVILDDKGLSAETSNSFAETGLQIGQSFLGGFSSLFGGDKKSKKITDDYKVKRDINTIPGELEFKTAMLDSVSEMLQKMIAPHYEKFEVALPQGTDAKTSSMFWTSAYHALINYLINTKLSNDYNDLSQLFYEIEFKEGAEEVVKRLHRENFEEDNMKKDEKDKKPYVPLSVDELDKEAEKYLQSHLTDIYNLALAIEASGDYKKALEMYRFVFDKKSEKQQYADGIGRCLLALDMADRVKEKRNELSNSKQIINKESPVVVAKTESYKAIENSKLSVNKPDESDQPETITEYPVTDISAIENDENDENDRSVATSVDFSESTIKDQNIPVNEPEISDKSLKTHNVAEKKILQPENSPCAVWLKLPEQKQAESEIIMEALNAWKDAWSAMNLDAYLSFYAQNFKPDNGLNRKTWEKQRHRRFKKDYIKIVITKPEINFETCTLAKVIFYQKYESNSFKDYTMKYLVFQKSGTHWRIIKEGAN